MRTDLTLDVGHEAVILLISASDVEDAERTALFLLRSIAGSKHISAEFLHKPGGRAVIANLYKHGIANDSQVAVMKQMLEAMDFDDDGDPIDRSLSPLTAAAFFLATEGHPEENIGGAVRLLWARVPTMLRALYSIIDMLNLTALARQDHFDAYMCSGLDGNTLDKQRIGVGRPPLADSYTLTFEPGVTMVSFASGETNIIFVVESGNRTVITMECCSKQSARYYVENSIHRHGVSPEDGERILLLIDHHRIESEFPSEYCIGHLCALLYIRMHLEIEHMIYRMLKEGQSEQRMLQAVDYTAETWKAARDELMNERLLIQRPEDAPELPSKNDAEFLLDAGNWGLTPGVGES